MIGYIKILIQRNKLYTIIRLAVYSFAAQIDRPQTTRGICMGWWKKITVAFGMLLLLLGESMRECQMFRMTHYFLKVPVKRGQDQEIKIIFLSDLHNKIYGKKNECLLESIRKEKPDLILIGGDMLIGKKGVSPDAALELIRQLPRIAPVYYALGNHEQRMKLKTEKYGNVMSYYKRKLMEAGVHFLENDSAEVSLYGMELRLTGLELPMRSYEKFKRASVTSAQVKRLVGPADGVRYQILLAHNPVYVPAYKKWGADLVLCGHLHGGVVRIPGWRGVITPRATLFPRYSGELTMEGRTTVVVSKGLGTHTVNFRLFNPSEVVVLHL